MKNIKLRESTKILKMKIIQLLLQLRYYIFCFRKPLKVGFMRLYNEENTVIACLMSVVDMLDKIVLIYSDIDDCSLELVKQYIKDKRLEQKIIIRRYPHHVYTQNAKQYSGNYQWKNTLAAYYLFGYDICCKLARFRNGFIAKVDADQIYMNDCFNKIEQEMKKAKYVRIINSFGGYNGYVNQEDNSYGVLCRPKWGRLNGGAGDHLCIPFGLCGTVTFRMDINAEHAWEVLEMPTKYYRFKRQYDEVMWFHFNQKKPQSGELQGLTEEEYNDYMQKIFPLLETAKSKYVQLKIMRQ